MTLLEGFQRSNLVILLVAQVLHGFPQGPRVMGRGEAPWMVGKEAGRAVKGTSGHRIAAGDR